MKKAVSVIISVILLFTAFVTGCNKADNDNTNTNTNGVPRKITEDSIWYDTTRLEIDISDKGTQIGFEPICSDDENIYLYCDIYKEPVTKEEWEATNGGSSWGEVIKYSYKDQKIVWDKKVDNNSSVFRNKDDLVIMTSIHDPDTYKDTRSLFKMDDATGEIKEEIKGTKILTTLNLLPAGSYIVAIIPQESGLAFCVSQTNMDGSVTPIIHIMDDAGNVTTKNIQSECKKLDIRQYFRFCKMSDNEILVKGGDWNDSSGFIMNTSDDTYKPVAEKSPLIGGNAQGSHDWRYCGNGVCYSDNYGINMYDASSDTEMRSLDFNNANTDRYEFLGDMRPLVYSDTKIVMGGMAQTANGDGKYVIYVFDKAEKNPNAKKTVITVADTVDDFTQGLSRSIYEFNNNSNDVYVALDDRYFLSSYLEEEEMVDYKKAINDDYFGGTKKKWDRLLSSRMTSKLRMDILSGKGPDIILNASSYSQLDNGDVFADLSGRLDALDQDLYDNVIDFFKTDGKLYQVPVSFTVSGMTEIMYDEHGPYYNNPFGDGKTGVTFDEFEEYVINKSNGKNYFTFRFSRDELFMLLFKRIEKDLIRDGRFEADCEQFRKTAEYAMNTSNERSYASELQEMNDEEEISLFQNDIQILANDRYTFPGAGVAGVPTADGSVGPMAYSDASAGITCACSNPDAAWEFVSFLLSPSGQKIMVDYRLPQFAINRDAMKDIAYEYEKLLMTPNPREYNYEPGNEETHNRKMPPNPTEEEIRDKTDKEMKKAEDFILSLSGSVKSDTDIENVVLEEMASYFSQDKSLDDVIPIINNRVNTILAERHK
ncbi:MAG: extracellular solute-binding protein [Clostridiales bacterium]|nr:extracellular solute-binding protein [Clostridiales bacterium]